MTDNRAMNVGDAPDEVARANAKQAACPHTYIFFPGAIASPGECMACGTRIGRQSVLHAPQPSTATETALAFVTQECELLRRVLDMQNELLTDNGTDLTAPQFFFRRTRLDLQIRSLLRHASELADARRSLTPATKGTTP